MHLQKGSERAKEKNFQFPKCSIQRASSVTPGSFGPWGRPVHPLEHPFTLNIVHLSKRFEALMWESGISHARAHQDLPTTTGPLTPSVSLMDTAQDCDLNPPSPLLLLCPLPESMAVVPSTAGMLANRTLMRRVQNLYFHLKYRSLNT